MSPHSNLRPERSRLQRLNAFFSVAILCVVTHAAERAKSSLPRSTPEAEGVSSSGILDFLDAADAQIDTMNSFMLLRHGRVVAEGWWAPYGPESPHELYSLSKSFTSTAVGLAVGEGKLSIDDEVLKFFPDDAPPQPSANLKAMRVRDLLCMSTGHQDEPPTGPDVVSAKSFLAQPVPFKPGTHFKYNTAATFMLSAIVQKVTGMTVLDYLRPRLFEPLGIEHPTWQTNYEGISLGGYGLSVRTEDIAHLGQLYLQKGKWGGRRLVPASWVEAATSRQTSNGSSPTSDWDQGYGYQFWRCRHAAFRGDGAFGQYCIVMPEQDAVVAITSGVRDMQAVMNLVWDRLLPTMQSHRLPADAANQRKLGERLAGLAVRMQTGAATSPLAARIAGHKFMFPENSQKIASVALEPAANGDGTTLIIDRAGKEWRVPCGYGVWKKSRSAFGQYAEAAVGACGAWTGEDTFTAKLCAYETPFYVTVKLQVAGDELRYDLDGNVGFGSTKQPELVGKAR